MATSQAAPLLKAHHRVICSGALALLVGSQLACSADVGIESDADVESSEQAVRKDDAGKHPGKCKEKVRICHFGSKKHSANIIEVAEEALPAHLAHGDGLAPPTVKKDADCLVPQAPPEPVAVVATTGADGIAGFIVPQTNIRVVAAVVDETGVALPGVRVNFIASEARYLLIAEDAIGGGPTRAPAFSEGSLLDARPGSAPTIAADIVMRLFTSTFPGTGILQPGGSIPEFVVDQFVSTSDQCFTEAEFRNHLLELCVGGSIAGSSISTFIFSLLGFAPSLVTPSLASVFQAFNATQCAQHAAAGAAMAFQGAASPTLIRGYQPPFLPGVPTPYFFQYLGSCGGACCDSGTTTSCADVSSASACTSGDYQDGTYCSSDPCDCSPPNVRCGGRCVDVQTDPDNCGACGNACDSDEACVAGQCSIEEADLRMSLVSPAVPPESETEPGFLESFEFHIENRGPANAAPMVVRIALSGPIYDISASARVFSGQPTDPFIPCEASGGDLLCDLSALQVPAGSVVAVTGELAASGPGPVRLRATGISFVSDPQPSDNGGTAGWDFECPASTAWDPIAHDCSCTPTTCAATGATCGTISDGCGGSLDCGSCIAPETCGGAGVANECGAAACPEVMGRSWFIPFATRGSVTAVPWSLSVATPHRDFGQNVAAGVFATGSASLDVDTCEVTLNLSVESTGAAVQSSPTQYTVGTFQLQLLDHPATPAWEIASTECVVVAGAGEADDQDPLNCFAWNNGVWNVAAGLDNAGSLANEPFPPRGASSTVLMVPPSGDGPVELPVGIMSSSIVFRPL